MEKELKVWESPQLIVIVRSMPEESVLVACKQSFKGGATGGAAANKRACQPVACILCSGASSS